MHGTQDGEKAQDMNNSALYENEDQQTETRQKFDAQDTELKVSADEGCMKFKLGATHYTPLW